MDVRDDCNVLLLKTPLGMERVAASYVEELDPGSKVIPEPRGFKGLVLVEAAKDKRKLAEAIKQSVPEVERVVIAEACTRAEIGEMSRVAAEVAARFISPNETFAVRTVRRGKHQFTSIDVNVAVGDAVRRVTGASVNLKHPDKVVAVEILQDLAIIAVYPGTEEYHKMGPSKYPLFKVFSKIAVVQMPYLGPLDACRNMGVRIGREVQNFEVRELVIAPIGLVEAIQLATFIEGVIEGIESRFSVQARSYGRKPRKVPIYLQDLYQLVRERRNEPIIVFEPEGDPISRRAGEVFELLKRGKRVNILVGAREGIPQGVFRFADLVLDIAPSITLSTDYAAAAALTALGVVVHDKLAGERSGEDEAL
ncbi:MAG: SPOUT family RNA methylase [Thermoproteota archaeon]